MNLFKTDDGKIYNACDMVTSPLLSKGKEKRFKDYPPDFAYCNSSSLLFT